MKNVSRRIQLIFEKYYSDRAKNRYVTLVEFAEQFMNELYSDDFDGYYIDKDRLIKAVDSYFLDVIKFKEYHFNPKEEDDIADVFSEEWAEYIHTKKKINASKVAAFTAKWLLKASPIFIKSTEYERPVDDKFCYVNELFVLNCVLYHLLKLDATLIDEKSFGMFFYDFKYRPFDERAYFSRFELLEEVVKQKIGILGEKKHLTGCQD